MTQNITAIQVLSHQLAAALANNAELIEQAHKMSDEIAALKKEIDDLKAIPPKDPQ